MRNRIVLTALIFLPAYIAAQNPGKLTQEEMHKLHQNSKAYIALLEDPQRDAYQKPHVTPSPFIGQLRSFLKVD